MNHRHHGETAGCELFQQLEQRQRAAAVEATRGFVQEQAERSAGQGNTEADAAPLAAADAAARVG
jgi:hypothetical protein